MEYEGDCDTNCNWCTWNNPQSLGKEARRVELENEPRPSKP